MVNAYKLDINNTNYMCLAKNNNVTIWLIEMGDYYV